MSRYHATFVQVQQTAVYRRACRLMQTLRSTGRVATFIKDRSACPVVILHKMIKRGSCVCDGLRHPGVYGTAMLAALPCRTSSKPFAAPASRPVRLMKFARPSSMVVVERIGLWCQIYSVDKIQYDVKERCCSSCCFENHE